MFTFGIVTQPGNENRLYDIVASIHAYGGSTYQVICVGGQDQNFKGISYLHIPYNDHPDKPGEISSKKNLIIKNAEYSKIVIMHDYVVLCAGWYDGFLKFEQENPNWLTCTNKILTKDGKRFRDYAVLAHDSWVDFRDNSNPPFSGAGRLIAYDSQLTDKVARWFYYSGAYFVIKKSIGLEVPFNETRKWGEGEDVLHGRDLYFKFGTKVFSLNPYSYVRFLKDKGRASWENLPEIRCEDY